MNGDIQRVILSVPRMQRLFDHIMKKNQFCWKKFTTPDDIFRWLFNFKNKKEIYYALILGNGITYYNDEEVRYLWNLIFTNRLKRHICETVLSKANSLSPEKIDKYFINFIKNKCIFVAFGKIDTSGTHMIYFFRRALPSGINHSEIKYIAYDTFLTSKSDLSGKKIVILLDDFIGTGKQAIVEWKDRIIKSGIYRRNKHIRYLYLALTGFLSGVNNIENKTEMKVILGTPPMEDNSRCFSPISDIYRNSIERREAELIMKKIGRILYRYPLGYENDQAAIAFFHNTPTNTLPVIWKRLKDGGWHPLFEGFE